jgi:uncharacterized iron-regulated membrane protein
MSPAMRTWHRRTSIFVAVFMLVIAVTGVVLQAEMRFGEQGGTGGPPPGAGTGAAGPTDAEVQALVASSLAGLRRQTQGPLMGVDLRLMGPAPSAEFVVSDPSPRKLRLDARSGALLDAGAPAGGLDLHRFLLELHRGTLFGDVGYWVSVACGLVLAVLSVTGLVLYVQMLRRRLQVGQRQWLW